MATEAVLNRGAGKVRDHSQGDERIGRIDPSKISPEERAVFTQILKKMLGIT